MEFVSTQPHPLPGTSSADKLHTWHKGLYSWHETRAGRAAGLTALSSFWGSRRGFPHSPIIPGGREGSLSPNLRPEPGEHRRRHLAERCRDGHASICHSADDRYRAVGSKTASGEFDKPRACPHRDISSPACFVQKVSLSSTACSESTLINLSCEKSNSER